MPVNKQQYVVDDIALAARVWTSAEPRGVPVVLLAGTGLTAQDWDQYASQLSDTRPVLCLDHRGHGDSDWPGDYSISALAGDAAGVLEQLPYDEVDLIGHSLGGLVALLVAATKPNRVRRLVLEDVGLLQPREAKMPDRPDGELDFDWRLVGQIRPEIDTPSIDWRAIAGQVRCPTLVVGGRQSSVPQEQVAELADVIAQANLVTIDAGHLIHATRPDEFAAVVATFLDGD